MIKTVVSSDDEILETDVITYLVFAKSCWNYITANTGFDLYLSRQFNNDFAYLQQMKANGVEKILYKDKHKDH